MRCGKAQRLISIALDGELDPERDQALRAHLTGCGECRRVATSFQQLGRALDVAHAAEPKWGFAERLAARIANSEQPPTARFVPWLRGRLPALAAGTAAFCAGAALVILANGNPTDQPQPRTDVLAALADTTIGLSAGPAPDEQLISLLFPSLEE